MLIVIEHDQDADFSFYSEEDRASGGLIALEMMLYLDGDHYGIPVASLSNITFFEDGYDWITGEFTRVEDIPAECDHLRGVARELLAEVSPIRLQPRIKAALDARDYQEVARLAQIAASA